MRTSATLSATFLAIAALFLSACSVDPHLRENTKNELGKLKGPDTSSLDAELNQQAEQAVAQGDYKQAAQLYKQLIDQTPDNMAYQLGFAESLRRIGNCILSLKVTDVVIAKDPRNAEAIENKGLCLMSTGEFAEAGDVFSQVMKIDSKRWRTLNAIGILFAMKGKYDGAIAYFQGALNVSTDNPSVLNNAALTYAIDQQFDRSYEAFGRARRHVSPGSADMKHLDLNLALVYAVDGKLDLAEQTATPYLSKEGLYNNMGFYSYLSKNNELAKGYLNMALTQSPTYYERAWKNLGALTGDTTAGAGQAMPAPDRLGADNGSMSTLPGITQPAAVPAAPQPVGISLDDIPESKSLHVPDETAPVTPKTIIKPAAKAVAKTPVPQADNSQNSDDAVPAPIVLKRPDGGDTSAASFAPASPAATSDLNPDIVMLHKPVPAKNPDWDVDKKSDTSAMPASGPAPGGSAN